MFSNLSYADTLKYCVKYTTTCILLIKKNNKTKQNKKVWRVEPNSTKLSKINFPQTKQHFFFEGLIPSNMETFCHLSIEYAMLVIKITEEQI